jgi:hypothetical protein
MCSPGRSSPAAPQRLHGQLTAPRAVPLTPDRGSLLFFDEVGQQHATDAYMQLIGAPVMSPALAKLLLAAWTQVVSSAQSAGTARAPTVQSAPDGNNHGCGGRRDACRTHRIRRAN